MSWFPTFSSLSAGLIAAGIAVPALLVLYFLKLRRKEVTVASTLLWQKAVQDLQVNSPFQKLRRNLLLLLQMLILLLLVLAIAGPISNYTPPPGKRTVFLIDRSASMSTRDMNGKTRLEVAKEQARDLVDAMPKGGTAMVVAFADDAASVQPFTGDTLLLKSAIDGIQQSDRPSDIKLAYQLADAQNNFDVEQLRPNQDPPDVRVFSDGRLERAEEASIKGNVTFHKMGVEAAKNIAVVSLSAKRSYERPTQVQVFARLANYGPEPANVPVQLSIDGEKVTANTARADELYLLPERWPDERRQKWEADNPGKQRDSVDFKLDLTRSAVIRLEQLNKKADDLPDDDFAQVVVPPPRSLSVLLITEGNYFLKLAVQSLETKTADVLSPADYEANKPTNYDVCIFDNYKPKFLPEAGNFMWFGAVPDGIGTKVATTALPGAPAGKGEPVVLEDVGVLDWKREHPILDNLALSRLYAARALKLNVPLDREVLLDGLKGPLIVLERSAKATHLICAFDVMQSNWPLKPSFPIFIHQALQYLAIGQALEVRQSLRPGEVVRIQRANLQQAGADLKKIKVVGPSGTHEMNVPEDGGVVLPVMDRVGLYKTEPPIPDYEQLAVNILDANESNVLPAEKIPASVATEGSDGASGKRRFEWLWWLVLSALAVLTLEWWVYVRRVHL